MKLIPALIPVLLLAACGGETPAAKAPEEAEAKGGSYKIQITLTPGSQAKLRDMGEKVTIANMFYGTPRDGVAAGDDGQLQLGEVMRDIAPQNQIVTIAEPTLDKLSQIEGKPMLLINVYTARQKHPDNLLSCGIFDDELAKAEAATIEIECDLIDPEVIEHAPVVAPTDEN